MKGDLHITMHDQWLPLAKTAEPLTTTAPMDEIARVAVQKFDLRTDGTSSFIPWERPDLPEHWGIGVIVGRSGSGKSTLLRHFGEIESHRWTEAPIVSHFESADAAVAALAAAGLNSVPTWIKPYRVLSNGERFRADLARSLRNEAVIDEYTSVVDRTVAAGASRSLARYVTQGHIRKLVLATVHRDVIEWLQPDWIIDTDEGRYALNPRECLQRRSLVVRVYEVSRSMWDVFAPHHYLTSDLHPFARCYIAEVDGHAAAFAAAIPFPHASIRNGWRGSRLVTLPDYQGLGIGPRLADWVARAHALAGYTYYAKTTHPRLGEYRDAHPNWQSTSHSRRKTNRPRTAPTSFGHRDEKPWVGSTRPSYSHRYVIEDDQ